MVDGLHEDNSHPGSFCDPGLSLELGVNLLACADDMAGDVVDAAYTVPDLLLGTEEGAVFGVALPVDPFEGDEGTLELLFDVVFVLIDGILKGVQGLVNVVVP